MKRNKSPRSTVAKAMVAKRGFAYPLLAMTGVFGVAGCMGLPSFSGDRPRLVPAEEFSASVHNGEAADFSIFRAADKLEGQQRGRLGNTPSPLLPPAKGQGSAATNGFGGDPKLLEQGFQLKQSLGSAPEVQDRDWQTGTVPEPEVKPVRYVPPGSQSPYATGQMTANPSLWPDNEYASSLFRDFRAFQPMDVITIVIDEKTVGKKKAETDAKTEYSISAAIANFFGIETRSWESNNEALDAENLINATTTSDFSGEGETKREGSLKGRMSAVIMEVLPNSVLRIEGTKIVSVDDEEEVMVLSGLIRQRDVDSANQIDSSRIANMRVDFYGRGIIGAQQTYGWGVKLFKLIWPF